MSSLIRRWSVLAIWAFLAASPALALQELSDDYLSRVTGQALIQMGKAPGEVGSGLTFYKAGLDAEIEINLNIEKLQLGCTGAAVNGQHCDIDIDNLSLSGNSWAVDRPEAAALLTRPFFEFAIKNDDDKTRRQVVGVRLSAENTQGMMTFGTENSSTPNGINSFSGYMDLMQATGFGEILPINMSFGCNQSRNAVSNCGSYIDPVTMRLNGNGVDCTTVTCTIATNTAMVGTLCIYVTFPAECGDGRYAGNPGNTRYSSTDYRLPITANGTATYPVVGGNCPANRVCFTTQPTQVFGKRMTSVQLTGAANVPTISFSCGSACTFAETSYIGIDLNARIQGSMSGLTATVPITQALGMIHKLSVDTPFSLSFQSENMRWPGENSVAQSGWWMAFNDPINLGSVSTSKPLVFTPEVLQQAICSPAGVVPGGGCTGGQTYNGYSTGPFGGVNDALWYQRGGAIVSNAIVTLISPDINVGNLPLTAVVNYPFTNPQLSEQSFTPNCWGNARFC